MALFLPDTTVLIDHLRGRRGVTERLLELTRQGHLLISCSITIAELFSHLRPPEELSAQMLLSGLIYRDIPRRAAEQAGRLRYTLARQGRTLSAPDALIGGLAVTIGATLLTKNIYDFSALPGLALEELPHGL